MARRSPFKWPRPGICRVCGCTEHKACAGGCSWVDRDTMVCSSCSGTDGDIAGALWWISKLIERHGVGRKMLTVLSRIAREARERYSERLVNEEHG